MYRQAHSKGCRQDEKKCPYNLENGNISAGTDEQHSVTGVFITEPKENLVDEYEYGQDGRLLKHKTYKLEGGGSTSLDKIFTYKYVMTDSGYI